LASLDFPRNVIDTADAFEFPRVNVQNFQASARTRSPTG
jgi:hypothetical protein